MVYSGILDALAPSLFAQSSSLAARPLHASCCWRPASRFRSHPPRSVHRQARVALQCTAADALASLADAVAVAPSLDALSPLESAADALAPPADAVTVAPS